jgi:hypothetical protein
MSEGILANAKWVQNARSSGGTYATYFHPYPFRFVFHTIEGWLSERLAATHAYPPHLWYSPSSRTLLQTVPLSRSGFALYQDNNGQHYTNKARAIQVELEGWSSEAGNWPEQYLINIAEDVLVPVVLWLRSIGEDLNLDNVPDIGVIPMSARTTAPQRMLPEDEWADFDGVCSHRHVPQNDHWDSGNARLDTIAWHAKRILAAMAPAAPEDPPAPVVPTPPPFSVHDLIPIIGG